MLADSRSVAQCNDLNIKEISRALLAVRWFRHSVLCGWTFSDQFTVDFVVLDHKWNAFTVLFFKMSCRALRYRPGCKLLVTPKSAMRAINIHVHLRHVLATYMYVHVYVIHVHVHWSYFDAAHMYMVVTFESCVYMYITWSRACTWTSRWCWSVHQLQRVSSQVKGRFVAKRLPKNNNAI